VSPTDEHPLIVAARCVTEGRPVALATVIAASGSTPRQAGAKMLVFPDSQIVGSVGGGRLEHDTIQAALECLATGRSSRIQPVLADDLGMCCGGLVEVFIEPLVVAAPAVIYGAGHVARAVAPLLRTLGFQVTVVDDRPSLLTEAFFPACTRLLTDPESHARACEDSPRTYVLVMSHDHGRDVRIVTSLSNRDLAYIGMLGAHRKRRFLEEALRQDPAADDGVLERLKAPIGLDIGARNPIEIAVAIAAEIIAARADSAPAATGPSAR
jgi:xanthine dehydrogenase accessory factor